MSTPRLTRLIASFFAALLAYGASACISTDLPDDGSDGPTRIEQGLGVSGAAIAHSDVDKMEFRIYNCGGTTPIETKTSGIEPMTLPGGIEEFENAPYDPDSKHAFADKYFLLGAGCYDVEVEPLKSDGQPSTKCSIASKQGVTVTDGQTTEILLISQCQGQARGGLDVIATLNHPPRVDGLEFIPSKFISCPNDVTICVDASDPDNDPMRVEWNILSGPTPLTLPQVTTSSVSNGTLTECIKFKPGVGNWTLEVTVFDQLFENGLLTDFETYYTNQGNPQQSRDSLSFPLYGEQGTCGPPDTGVDAGVDVGTDVGMDAAVDVGVDVGVDAGVDTGVDAGTDAGGDAGGDAGIAGCTRTQGYWQGWNKYAKQPNRQIPWPIAGGEDQLLCGETWLDILNTPVGGSSWYNLAHQYIPAKLNEADGTTVPANVQSALSTADSLLPNYCLNPGMGGHFPAGPVSTQALSVKDVLDDYNNGLEGVPKCP